MMMTRSASFFALSIALLPAPALAQTELAPAAPTAPQTAQDDDHHDHSDEIVVTGIRRKAGDVLGGLSVLDAEELARELRPSIGETLARQPGVSATSFGPAASRPILRGLSGDRIRVLTDGIGSFDVSASSPDHAVAINPLTAEVAPKQPPFSAEFNAGATTSLPAVSSSNSC